MTLTNEQNDRLIENYATHIVDTMSTEDLMNFVYQNLIQTYEVYTEKELIDEMENILDRDVLRNLVESSGANFDDISNRKHRHLRVL